MNQSDRQFVPLISPHRQLAEVTIKAIVLGAILSMLLASANAYIGLLVGLTVSASIPAAAVSMGVLRLFPDSNILENNMVQTSASAGESLVAGIIFTIPALVLMNAWQGYEYWPLVSIALVGGILGVCFTIPLRRALIVEAKLAFPEGVATAQVLKSGSSENNKLPNASRGLRHLLQSAGIGALFKLLESGFGMLESSISTIKTLFGGSLLMSFNLSISPALIGVGYIVGLNIAILVFIGGVIGTVVGVPLNWLLNSDSLMAAAGISTDTPLHGLTTQEWSNIANVAWDQNRRIGVGAMIIGGLWSLITLIKPLIEGIKASISAYQASLSNEGQALLRTEQDTPINIVALVAAFAAIPLFFIFDNALGNYQNATFIALVMTILMLMFGFIFASVAGYMAGLVGSSNNPISGVTIATVIISSLLLLQLMGSDGLAAKLGPIAVIYLAGLICSAAAIAGDNMQDLKCGHILGATPWRQQLFQVVGVVSSAMVIPFVLNILDAGYGIGRPAIGSGSETFLAAPQAGLMKALSTGIFGAGIDWQFIYLGFALAIVLIILDEIQRHRGSEFRFPVLAVAVGIYLPLGLSVPIFFGGLIAYLLQRKSKSLTDEAKQTRKNTGLLLASGLITGEALMGVFIAIVAAFIFALPSTMPFGEITGVIAFVLVMLYLYKRTKSAKD